MTEKGFKNKFQGQKVVKILKWSAEFPPEFCSISWQPCIVPKYGKPEIFSHNPGLNIIFYKKKYISTLCEKI